MSEANKVNFTRVKNDVNGNPRYVCHFLNLLTREELDATMDAGVKYAIATKRANKIGGRKFHNRSYGGGIVFQSYSLRETVNHINSSTGRNFDGYIC